LVSQALDRGTYRVGRWKHGQTDSVPEIPISGAESFISKQHCHFIVEPGLIEVVDGWPDGLARSTFGVYVNGVRVDRFEVEVGDQIVLGDPTDPERHVWVELAPAGAATAPHAIPQISAAVEDRGRELAKEIARVEVKLRGGATAWAAEEAKDPPGEQAAAPSPVVRQDPWSMPHAAAAPEDDTGFIAEHHVSEYTGGVRPTEHLPQVGSVGPTPDQTEIATREAEVEVIRGISQADAERLGLPEDRAGYRGRRFRLHQHQQELVIGRENSCDIVIYDTDPAVQRRISRQHARIEYRPEEGSFRLYNRSGNGTIVQRLRQPVMDDAVLTDRDVIVIGSTALKITISQMERQPLTGARRRAVLGLVAAGAVLLATGLGAVAWHVQRSAGQHGRLAPTVRWSRAVSSAPESRVATAVGRLAGTAARDVAVSTSDGGVLALDGVGGNPLWSQRPALEGAPTAVIAADLDGDGLDEVVVASAASAAQGGKVSVLAGGSGQLRWTASAGCRGSCSYFGPPVIADITGDGLPELLVAGESGGQGFVAAVNARTGQTLWAFDGSSGRGLGAVRTGIAMAAPQLGAPPVVVAAGDDGVVVMLDAVNGSLRGMAELRSGPIGFPALGDVTGDGSRELILLSRAYALAVMDVATGKELGTWVMSQDLFGVPPAVADRRPVTAPLLVDLDGDTRLDVVVANPGRQEDVNTVHARSGAGLGELWSIGVGNGLVLAPPAAAELSGDGTPDVVLLVSYPGRRQVTLQLVSGRDGRVLSGLDVMGSPAATAPPLLVDLTGQGVLDCVVGLEGGTVSAVSLGVLQSLAGSWAWPRGDAGHTGEAPALPKAGIPVLLIAGVGGVLLGLAALGGALWVRRRVQWAFA